MASGATSNVIDKLAKKVTKEQQEQEKYTPYLSQMKIWMILFKS